jgi:hypothetical protein
MKVRRETLFSIVLDEAASLLTEPGDNNPEYDRALVELTCQVLGLSTDESREPIERLLRTRQDRMLRRSTNRRSTNQSTDSEVES